MVIGDNLEVQITSLDHYGRGIARHENGIIFISNTLTGEVASIEIIKAKKNYFEANCSKLVKISPERINPVCPYYQECGGCDLLHMTYKSQLAFKENKVKEIISKFTKLDTNIIRPIVNNNDSHYRNKITLQVKQTLGFYKKNSHDIVAIEDCLIANEKINNLIKILKKLDYKNFNQIVLRIGIKTNQIMLVIDCLELQNKTYIIDTFKDKVSSIIWKRKHQYITLYGENCIIEKMGKYEFIISPESFFQVNTDVATMMYDKVLEYAALKKTDNVLDLYCGTGTIGIYLSEYAGRVIGVEINKYAIDNAIKNKQTNGISNIDFHLGDVTEVIKKLNFKPNVVIVDPPRSGLDKDGIEVILQMKPSRIVYVSCDPVTLARDLNYLISDYNVIEITPYDMFSNTYHVECVTLLHRKN